MKKVPRLTKTQRLEAEAASMQASLDRAISCNNDLSRQISVQSVEVKRLNAELTAARAGVADARLENTALRSNVLEYFMALDQPNTSDKPARLIELQQKIAGTYSPGGRCVRIPARGPFDYLVSDPETL